MILHKDTKLHDWYIQDEILNVLHIIDSKDKDEIDIYESDAYDCLIEQWYADYHDIGINADEYKVYKLIETLR